MKKKIVLGVTGGMGCGKSTVAEMLRARKALIIDADRIAREVLHEKAVHAQIVRQWGAGILKPDKSIDRVRFAQAVFGHARSLKRLNAIMHPRIKRAIRKKIASSKRKVLVVDAPLLIEAGLKESVDIVIVVAARTSTQLKRILAKGRLSREEVMRRMRCQMPLKDKIRAADFVIDNNGPLARTRAQVDTLWKQVSVMQGGCSGKARY